MEKLLTSLLLLLFCQISICQTTYQKKHAYLDAMKLTKLLMDNEEAIIDIDYKAKMIFVNDSLIAIQYNEILAQYGVTSIELADNPFLMGCTSEPPRGNFEFANTTLNVEAFNGDKSYERPMPTSMNWQASIINGLASFMAGRFKQEALHVAIDQMFNQIKSEKYAEFTAAVFPKTVRQINQYDKKNEAYYTADLMILRQLAEIDIQDLPENMIKNTALIFPEIKEKPVLNDLLSMSGYIVKYSKQGLPIDRLISSVASSSYSTQTSALSGALKMMDVLTQALISEEGSKNNWISSIYLLPINVNELESLKSLDARLFYGLLYEQLLAVPEFYQFIIETEIEENAGELIQTIQSFTSFTSRLNGVFTFAQDKAFNLSTSQEKMTFIREVSASISDFLISVDDVFGLSKNMPEVAINRGGFLEITSSYFNIVESLQERDYQKAVPLLLVEFGQYMGNDRRMMRILSFLSGLAMVETASDMENLLKSYALPIGSSSIKRTSKFNVAVNGYVGFTGGWETAYGSYRQQVRGNIGLAAPIGLSFTFGGYFTTFVSVIDLGSLVNQRLNNDVAYYSNIKFEHFFTPGLGLYFNVPKLPISAGVHFNYIPNLRNIQYENGNATITEENRSVTRLNFSILMDIPMFNLFNRERNRN